MASRKVKVSHKTSVKVANPIRLDLGCGNGDRKKQEEGWIGVDKFKRPGVDVVCDLSKPKWPWKDNSVDEVHCSHLLEHIPALDRITFFNELWRIMKPEAKATIITPHWCSNRAYGDVTHQWPPVSEMFWFSLDPAWRKVNQPHLSEGSGWEWEYKCHFVVTWGYSLAAWCQGRTPAFVNDALAQYKEAAQDMVATLVKKP